MFVHFVTQGKGQMNTFWLLGKGDSMDAISQISMRSIEQAKGTNDDIKEMDPIAEEENVENVKPTTDEVFHNGLQQSNADCNDNNIKGSVGNGFAVVNGKDHLPTSNGSTKRDKQGQTIMRNKNSLRKSSSIDSKMHSQLETPSQKEAVKFKKKNTVQSSACVVL